MRILNYHCPVVKAELLQVVTSCGPQRICVNTQCTGSWVCSSGGHGHTMSG